MAKEKHVTGTWPVTTYDHAGKPVPPGKKNAIPERVAEQIKAIHGDKVVSDAPASSSDAKALDAITAERDAAQAERDTAKADIAKAGEAWQALRASLEAAEDTDDAKAIEERIAAMDEALPASS